MVTSSADDKRIVSWTERQLLPTVSKLDAKALSALRREQDVVVGCFAEDDDESHRNLEAVARDLHEDYAFGLDDGGSIAEQEQLLRPSIVIFKNFDEEKTIIQLPLDIVELTARIKSTCMPFVAEIQPEVHRNYVDLGLPIAYTFTDGTSDEQAKLKTALASLAQQHHGRILFATVDTRIFNSLAEDLHVNTTRLPAFAIQDAHSGHRFPLSQEQTLPPDTIDTFVSDFLSGKLKPTIKSAPAPTQQERAVTVVVGTTYDDLVITKDRDVLLNYYTPWCGPCKAMEPQYDELARLFASNVSASGRVTVAKVDAEANDVPGDVRGFLTVRLFPADAKEAPVDYAGPRTVRGFADFIRDNGKYGIDVFVVEERPTASTL